MSYGYNNAVGGFNMAGMMAGQQGAHLAGMINQAQDAIAAENQSRVAQQRELRRLEHEKEMLRMQIEAQERQAALLQRLQAARQGSQPSTPGTFTNTLNLDDYGRQF